MIFVYAVIGQLLAEPLILWGSLAVYIIWDIGKIYIQIKTDKLALKNAKEACGLKDEMVLEFQRRTGTKF
jgi:hypothetical protein